MRAIVLGGDESILVEGSFSNRRMRDYARHLDELHIVVAARRGGRPSASGNLHLYPAGGRLAPLRWLRMLLRGASACAAVRPDLISTQDPGPYGLAGLLLARAFRLPLQVQVHTDVFSSHFSRASWREWASARLAAIVLPRASCIRVVSRRAAAAIVRRLQVPQERITVLPIHTDIGGIRARGSPAGTERDHRSGLGLISAGRFVEREKNFSLLLDAMAELRRDLPDARLVLAGDGPDRGRLQRRIRTLGLERRVRLEPWRDDLPRFLQSFDIFLLSSNYEGFPRVCVEAAAAGLPLVMTDVGPAGELFVDDVNALIVPVGDASAMAAAVRRLAADPALRARLVGAAQESIESIGFPSMESYARAYSTAMQACLER